MTTPETVAAGVVLGLDGHDGSGKTTLARGLAARVGGSYRRPFGGEVGQRFLEAGETGDYATTIAIGKRAITTAMQEDPEPGRLIILDRAWVTVASLMPWSVFKERWDCWVPTVVCWADIDVTLQRLAGRTEHPEPRAWHEHYINRYREIADVGGCPLVRTDDTDIAGAIDRLLRSGALVVEQRGA